MSLRGYVRKTKPANWTTVPGAVVSQPVECRRVRRQSKVARYASAGYAAKAAAFVAAAVALEELCPVVTSVPELRNGMKYGWPISAKINQVHHRYGRLGKLLMWEDGWMAVSTQGHRWIHSHVLEARKRGWICPIGMWNNQSVVGFPT